MRIVIEIPKECIPTRQDVMDIQLHFVDGKVVEASGYGFTVLPEKHGRLIDVDNIQEIELEDSLTVLTHKKGDEVDWYIDAPTILEADMVEPQERNKKE